MSASRAEKTLVFCTAFAHPGSFYYSWNVRYRLWIEAIRRSPLQHDQLLLIDDGSDHLPDWHDVQILYGNDLRCEAPLVIRHFATSLGRPSPDNFPGWVRSFFSASRYAEINGFTKIIHLEADAFLISDRAVDYVNQLQDGWSTVWCARHQWPERGLQVIAGSGLRAFKALAQQPVEDFATACIELTLPFTHVERHMIGDRYGEAGRPPPRGADWCTQAAPPEDANYHAYFWWLPWLADVLPELPAGQGAAIVADAASMMVHGGLFYLDWLREAEPLLAPQMYFEIGTHAGDSLRMIRCDAVCVDPEFTITTDVLMQRRNTHFFQGTSDAFFEDPSHAARLFPHGIDLAFLDGLHLFEALLRDFINTERFCGAKSLVLLHDCLPLNARMAQRQRAYGADDEPAEIRDFWTGDVWKLIPILGKFRPELTVSFLDCAPTGLVACTGLDRANTVLADRFHDIVNEFWGLTLEDFGLQSLWDSYPTLSSGQIIASSSELQSALFRGSLR